MSIDPYPGPQPKPPGTDPSKPTEPIPCAKSAIAVSAPRYVIVPPGATSDSDQHWYINDTEDGFAAVVINGDFPHAEQLAQYAMSLIGGE